MLNPGRLLLLFMALIAAVAPSQTHRIGIRTVNHKAEFFDRLTKKAFVPRGNNYIRLAHLKKITGGEFIYHSTFNPGLYDSAAVATDLGKMRQDRYNVVRVFLNYGSVDGIGGVGGRLSKPYMDNVVDFLRRVKADNIYVIFTIDWLPIPRRTSSVDSLWCSDFQCTNAHILTPEGLAANKAFFAEFVRELRIRSAPLDAILAYELRNELTFEPQLSPLSLSSGTVKIANGKTYDLSSPDEKTKMLNEGLVYWINQVRATIRAFDPTTLVTVGFIPPKDPAMSLKSQKLSITRAAFQESQMDFIDVHVYPMADGATLEEFVDRFGLREVINKPIVMGEFGVLRQHYPSAEAAARGLQKWQAASAQFGISGWLLWAWDSDGSPDTYDALDRSGLIDRVMAPIHRPDPAGEDLLGFPGRNLAFGSSVTASRSLKEDPAAWAVDGTARPWVSGDYPPQWIKIDLEKPTTIRMIRLMVAQTPAGETKHQIWVRGQNEEYRMLREFHGRTTDSQILELPTTGLVDIEFIKVITVQSPSWVGWKEIEVLK